MFELKRLSFFLVLLLTFCVMTCGHGAPSKAQKRSHISALSTLTATNGILTVSVDSASGQFTIETGAQHPHPNETVFFPIGTGYITLRDTVAKVMLNNGGSVFGPTNAGLAGYTVAPLDNASTTTVALGTTGFRTTFTVSNWQVSQDVVINGTVLGDSNVRHSVTVKNTGSAPRQFGVRYLWDWQIAGQDGSLFRTRTPDTNFTDIFATFSPPQFKFYEEVDDAINPTFSIFGSVRDLPLTPAPTLPDQVRYCDWNNSVDSAWEFSNTGINFDSAVCYYWGFDVPLDLAVGGSATFTQYVTTQSEAIAPALTVVKTGPATINTGGNLVYNFTVTNPGSAPATNVVLSDTIPTGTTYVSATGGTSPVVNTGVFTMNLPDIAALGQTTATLTVKVNATSGSIVNQTYGVTATGTGAVTGSPVTTQILVTPTPTPTPTPTLPPPGPLTGIIAFSSSRDGNNEIYTMNVDGTNPVRLTNNAAVDDQPNLSRDSKLIVFSSLRDHQREIYVMNLDGSNLKRLTVNSYSDYQPQFSADGSKIVFVSTRNGNAEIYSMKADGTGQTRLTNNDGVDDHPSFNKDATQIVFHSYRAGNHEIYRMNADGSAVKRLTAQAGVDTNPNYSYDGTRIVFQSNRVGGQNEIFWMNADGTGTRRVSFAGVSDTLACFNPAGTRIAFTTTRGGGDNEICLTTLSGEQVSGARLLTINFNDDSGPSWAPPVSSGNVGAAPVQAATVDAELSAEESSSSLTLRVASAPADGGAFTVRVNGAPVAVTSVTAQEDGSLILALPDGALSSGATVSVSWDGHQPVVVEVP